MAYLKNISYSGHDSKLARFAKALRHPADYWPNRTALC